MSAAIPVVAYAVSAVLLALAALHVFWACGGSWGGASAVPSRNDGEPLFRPGPGATLAVALLLAVAATAALGGAGARFQLGPAWLHRVGAGGVALAFFARAVGDFRWVGFFKRHRASPFARLDSRLYSPLCLAIATGSAAIALAPSS